MVAKLSIQCCCFFICNLRDVLLGKWFISGEKKHWDDDVSLHRSRFFRETYIFAHPCLTGVCAGMCVCVCVCACMCVFVFVSARSARTQGIWGIQMHACVHPPHREERSTSSRLMPYKNQNCTQTRCYSHVHTHESQFWGQLWSCHIFTF